MNLCKKCPAKPYCFLVIDTTLASKNPSCIRKNLLKRIWKLLTAIDDKIKDEKLQCDINREAARISPLSTGKIDKYEYLTGIQILQSDQSRIIEQAKFTHYPLSKTFKKQINQVQKQIKAFKEHEKQLVQYSDEKESLIHSKQKEIFEKHSNRRMYKIQYLSRRIDIMVKVLQENL